MSIAASEQIARALPEVARRRLRAPLALLDDTLRATNRLLAIPCMLAIGTAAGLLTASAVARYFLHAPTDWQEETAVLLLVGATFLSGAHVQARRGHVAIEVLATVLPPRMNRVRQALADLISVAFCGFFSWKSWTLFHEAWVDGSTSNSTFAPPMWIPYLLMAVGMSLLTLQIALQLLRPPATEPQ